jgi:hypothetical protein
MLMREINLKNKAFKEKLFKLSNEVQKVINDESTWKKCLQFDLDRQSPFKRKENGYPDHELYKHAPHWDILPDNCIDIKDKMDPIGTDYLKFMMDEMSKENGLNATSGFPNKEIFFTLVGLEQRMGLDYAKSIRSLVSDISYKFLGGNSVALAAFYPPGGYIPWHHNGNAPGWNVLLHYSFGGNGSFYTWDKGQVIEYKDKDNDWICRAGRFLDTVGTPRVTDVSGLRMGGEVTPHVGVNEASWHCARTFDWRFTLSTITNSEEIWLDIIDELETE